jgi:LysM repeat protein
MRRIISVLLISISTAMAVAQGTPRLQLADGAPDRHVVVRGDTLWGIASKFLKDPYRWGELWKLNAEEIKNPHLIYPGQVLVLDKSGNQPQLRLETVTEPRREYVDPLRKAIPSIPAQDIEPFLSEPRVIDPALLAAAPHVVALQDNRVVAGAGDTVFASASTASDRLFPMFLQGDARFTPENPEVIAQPKTWQLFRPSKPLLDPDTGETLGYESMFLGTARMTQGGVPSSFLVLTAKMEIQRDDQLLPAPRQDVPSYIPRSPTTMITGKVLAIYSGVTYGGPQNIVTLNRGKADGLEVGHVLAVDSAGAKVIYRSQDERTDYQLPDSRNGLMFVFRVYDRISYALIMNATTPVVVGDLVRTP